MTEGWKCPNCGKAHAPDVKTCPDPQINPWPGYPLAEDKTWLIRRGGCNCLGPCNNVACPHRTEITC